MSEFTTCVIDTIKILERYFQMMVEGKYPPGDPFAEVDEALVIKVIAAIDEEFVLEIKKNPEHWHNMNVLKVPSFTTMPWTAQRAMVKELVDLMAENSEESWRPAYAPPAYVAWYGGYAGAYATAQQEIAAAHEEMEAEQAAIEEARARELLSHAMDVTCYDPEAERAEIERENDENVD